MARKKRSLTENDVKRQIIDYLHRLNYLVLRVNSGAALGKYQGKQRYFNFVMWFARGLGRQTKGISDILAQDPDTGQLIAIETKRPGKEKNVSEFQQLFLAEVRARNGIGIVASSLEDVIEGLRKVENDEQ